jgi:XTP/dITP diphosphohydrolase
MIHTLYVASSNPGKLRDFSTAARSLGVRILPLPGMDSIQAPPEDEPTFAGNARAKAIYYSRLLPREIVIADDSGLEVAALNGAPGVRSARYAIDVGQSASETRPEENLARENPTREGLSQDERNNLYLLSQLEGVEEPERGARYTSVLAAARDGHVLLTAEGTVTGRILTGLRGTGGFGYDPLFYLPGLEQTMAEIDLETKDALSHRGKALRALLEELTRRF